MSEWVTGEVPAEATQRIRSAVWGRIRRRRVMRRTSGVLAVAALFVTGFWPADPPLETLAYAPPPPPAAPVWKPVLPMPQTMRRQPGNTEKVFMAQAAARPAERITILTDDPNVVIVLVADGGDE